MMDQLPAAVSFGENQPIHSQCTLLNRGSFTQSGGAVPGRRTLLDSLQGAVLKGRFLR